MKLAKKGLLQKKNVHQNKLVYSIFLSVHVVLIIILLVYPFRLKIYKHKLHKLHKTNIFECKSISFQNSHNQDKKIILKLK